MRLKEFLAESASVKNINVTKFNLDQLIDLYVAAGYEVTPRERRTFEDSKYGGFSKNRQHFYIVFCEDEEKSSGHDYYLTKFFIEFGVNGNLIAEPAGMPHFEGTYEECEAEFEKKAK